jgi:hypothetical protein
VGFLTVDADIAVGAVQPFLNFLDNLYSVVGLAQPTNLSLIVRVGCSDAGIDEGCCEPNNIHIYECHCEDEEEGGGIFESVESVQ